MNKQVGVFFKNRFPRFHFLSKSNIKNPFHIFTFLARFSSTLAITFSLFR